MKAIPCSGTHSEAFQHWNQYWTITINQVQKNGNPSAMKEIYQRYTELTNLVQHDLRESVKLWNTYLPPDKQHKIDGEL